MKVKITGKTTLYRIDPVSMVSLVYYMASQDADDFVISKYLADQGWHKKELDRFDNEWDKSAQKHDDKFGIHITPEEHLELLKDFAKNSDFEYLT